MPTQQLLFFSRFSFCLENFPRLFLRYDAVFLLFSACLTRRTLAKLLFGISLNFFFLAVAHFHWPNQLTACTFQPLNEKRFLSLVRSGEANPALKKGILIWNGILQQKCKQTTMKVAGIPSANWKVKYLPEYEEISYVSLGVQISVTWTRHGSGNCVNNSFRSEPEIYSLNTGIQNTRCAWYPLPTLRHEPSECSPEPGNSENQRYFSFVPPLCCASQVLQGRVSFGLQKKICATNEEFCHRGLGINNVLTATEGHKMIFLFLFSKTIITLKTTKPWAELWNEFSPWRNNTRGRCWLVDRGERALLVQHTVGKGN